MEPWIAKLSEGDTQAAWDLFDARYRRLILATIRRMVPERDDLMDVFGTVCHALSENDFARLKVLFPPGRSPGDGRHLARGRGPESHGGLAPPA